MIAISIIHKFQFGFFRRRSHERILLRRQGLQAQEVSTDPVATTQQATSNL